MESANEENMRKSPVSEMLSYIVQWGLNEFENYKEIQEQLFAEWMGWA